MINFLRFSKLPQSATFSRTECSSFSEKSYYSFWSFEFFRTVKTYAINYSKFFMMLFGVLGITHNFKIKWSVISLNMILMMHYLITIQSPTQYFFHNSTMFINVSAVFFMVFLWSKSNQISLNSLTLTTIPLRMLFSSHFSKMRLTKIKTMLFGEFYSFIPYWVEIPISRHGLIISLYGELST